jgi:hypothetical protein
MPALTLGSVVFRDFEIPEKVPLGGKQAGKLHKLPGGVRIFDAQGPDDNNITWKGRFRSNSAIGRAQQLDSMRRAGRAVDLDVLGLSYNVLIDEFKFDILRPYEVEYEITLIVIEDNSQGLDFMDALGGLDELVGADVSEGMSLLGGIADAVDVAATGFQTAISVIPQLAGASLSVLAPVRTAAHVLNGAIDAAVDIADGDIMEDPLGGNAPDAGVSDLLATMAAMNRQVGLLGGSAYMLRAISNIENDAG